MKSLRTTTRRAMLGFALILTVGCGDAPQSSPQSPPSVAPPDAKAQPVTIAKAGSRFDPSVDASSIPDGNWICDMGGKVHYAAGDRGDGKCPVCSMDLVHKGHGDAGKPMGGGGMGEHGGNMHKGHEGHEGKGHDH